MCTLWWLSVALAVQPSIFILLPEFTSNDVGRAAGYERGRIYPADVSTIYGSFLGPYLSCVRDTGGYNSKGPNSPEAYARALKLLPLELCGVKVLVNEQPVPLIYVHDKQINFLPGPEGSPGDRVTIRVVRFGTPSPQVWVKLGPDRIVVSQEGPAFTGMPLWVRVSNASQQDRPLPLGSAVLHTFLYEFCPHIEVMREGSSVPSLSPVTTPRRIRSGDPCGIAGSPGTGSLAGRVALHLHYRFDQPGTYLVRYTEGKNDPRPSTVPQSWTPIEVKANAPKQRAQWLRAHLASAPTDSESLIYDFLPSLFGYGDTAALNAALPYLYHQDAAVSGTTSAHLRAYYTAEALIPALEKTRSTRGPNPLVDRLLTDLRDQALLLPKACDTDRNS